MTTPFHIPRRTLLCAIAALSSGLAAAQGKPETLQTLRIGLQKSSTLTTLENNPP